MVVRKVMFPLAESLEGPQRGCSGMCLARGVKGRAYNWALLPVVQVKNSIGNLAYLLVISRRTAGVVEKLRIPDPRVNHYIVLVLLLASLPYQFVEESVIEGRRVQTKEFSLRCWLVFFSFFLSLPCYLLRSNEQCCFSSAFRTLKLTKFSS